MSHTPTKSDVKKLPMIVDIAIGNDGKQLYQVHESSKLVRKEMPRSTNFTSLSGALALGEEEKTPIRKILGTISPSTLNQKKLAEGDFMEQHHVQHLGALGHMELPNQQVQMHQSHVHGDFSHLQQLQHHHQLQGLPFNYLQLQPPQLQLQTDYGARGGLGGMLYYQTPHKPGMGGEDFAGGSGGGIGVSPIISSQQQALNDDNDIWSLDIEAAFEEVLSIIPKNGLSKIKISGRSCGRNELISDYIFQKTGKFRTRKQVSSHIQVIKNLGQKANIIKLINDGPVFETELERDENMTKFEQIFSKITLAKSMGVNDSVVSTSTKRALSLNSGSVPGIPNNPNFKRRKLTSFNIENFYISLQEKAYPASPTFTLTRQSNSPVKNLKIKEDANLSSRFPGLNEFSTLEVPFIHSMVKMKVPSQQVTPDFENLQSNYLIRAKTLESGNGPFSMFSCVYSFGQEVLKSNEILNFNDNSSFMLKFWSFFFKELLTKNQHDINMALKGVSIKQIIYETSSNSMASQKESSHLIPKLKIQSVLLWEFAAVDSYDDAFTTTSKLTLPKPRYQLMSQSFSQPYSNEIVPQIIESIDYTGTAKIQAMGGQPPFPTNSSYSPTPTSAFTGSYRSNIGTSQTQPTTAYSPPPQSAIDGSALKPQLSIQHKFQSLQEMHQLNLGIVNGAGVQSTYNNLANGSNPASTINNNGYSQHPSVGLDLMMPADGMHSMAQPPIHPIENSNPNPQVYQFGGFLVNSGGAAHEQNGFMNQMDL